MMENAQYSNFSLKHVIEQRLSWEVTHEPGPVVNGNASQLMQLLQNLIGNGIKYCEAAIPTRARRGQPKR